MTELEAFRHGFLFRCAEEGLTPTESRERAEKLASVLEKQALMGEAREGLGLVKDLMGLGLGIGGVGLGASVLAGALPGYALAKSQDSSLDADEVKRQELAATLRLHAEQLRRANSLRTAARASGTKRSPIFA